MLVQNFSVVLFRSQVARIHMILGARFSAAFLSRSC